MSETSLLAISNRSRHSACTNQEIFGSGFNQAGPCELRVAEASFEVRLGQISHQVASGKDIIHVDFSKARNVESQHWFFGDVIDNKIIHTFGTLALHGEPAEVCLVADGNEPGRYHAFPLDPFATPDLRR